MRKFTKELSPRKQNIGIYYGNKPVCGMSKANGYWLALFPSIKGFDIRIIGVDDI